MVEMKVKTIAIEAESRNPVMILTDGEEKRFLPIWIGLAEANAILSELEGSAVPRPQTHDLMKTLCEVTNMKMQRVIINDLQDSTYFARIIFDLAGKEVDVDARPSDSVALAVRFKAPIFVTENVIQKAAIPDKVKIEEDNKKFREWIENVKADLFSLKPIGSQPDDSREEGKPPEED